jgi:hypothetical protein
MSLFTLEVVRNGETPAVVDVVTLFAGKVSWRQVEALALMIDSRDDIFIRVKNDEGKTVIRAGVRTTLASIHHCPCMSCPIKRAFAKRAATDAGRRLRSGRLFLDDPAVYPCEMNAPPHDLGALSQFLHGDQLGFE